MQSTEKSEAVIKLSIFEIFSSIQGESSFVGRPAVFIRLAGCNLNCRWCDTPGALSGGERRSISEIVKKVLGFNIPLVLITGGEPLLQEGLDLLICRLLEDKIEVLIETNGSLDISAVPSPARVIMDCKPPSSGEREKMLEENFARLTEKDELKFVVACRNDFNEALKVIKKYRPRAGEILFSPVEEKVDFLKLSGWVSRDCPGARVQLNIHRVFGIR